MKNIPPSKAMRSLLGRREYLLKKILIKKLSESRCDYLTEEVDAIEFVIRQLARHDLLAAVKALLVIDKDEYPCST